MTMETHELTTQIAAYLDIFGGIIIAFFMTAAFFLPVLFSTTMPGYSITLSSTPTPMGTMTMITYNLNLFSLSAALGGGGYLALSLTTSTMVAPGVPSTSLGPSLNLSLQNIQVGSGGLILFLIALIIGAIAIVAGLVSRSNPRAGGFATILVVIILCLAGIPNLGLFPLLGTVLIAIGGVLSLAVSEL